MNKFNTGDIVYINYTGYKGSPYVILTPLLKIDGSEMHYCISLEYVHNNNAVHLSDSLLLKELNYE